MVHVYYLTQSQYRLKNMLQGMVYMLLEKNPLKKVYFWKKKMVLRILCRKNYIPKLTLGTKFYLFELFKMI